MRANWVGRGRRAEPVGRDTIDSMITGLAHSGVCVQDCDAAVAFYRDVLGMTVLSPPYVMDDDASRPTG